MFTIANQRFSCADKQINWLIKLFLKNQSILISFDTELYNYKQK